MSLNDEFDPDLPTLSAEEEARLGAELASLGAPGDAGDAGGASAREAFRAELRARFVAGTIEGPVETPVASAARVPIAARRPRVLRPWAAGLAAAALLAIVVFTWLPRPDSTPGPAWTVIAATADSTAAPGAMARIDGRDIALTALPTTTIAPGARVELPAGVTMELQLAGTLALETAPGTAFTVPTAGDTRRASVEHGEVRYVTGPSFAGTSMTVESPEAHVEVTGTTFVVIAAPSMTCVCVGEGTVHVTARGNASADSVGGTALENDITAGHRRELYPDGTMSNELTVHAHEAMKMQMLRDRMRSTP